MGELDVDGDLFAPRDDDAGEIQCSGWATATLRRDDFWDIILVGGIPGDGGGHPQEVEGEGGFFLIGRGHGDAASGAAGADGPALGEELGFVELPRIRGRVGVFR